MKFRDRPGHHKKILLNLSEMREGALQLTHNGQRKTNKEALLKNGFEKFPETQARGPNDIKNFLKSSGFRYRRRTKEIPYAFYKRGWGRW